MTFLTISGKGFPRAELQQFLPLRVWKPLLTPSYSLHLEDCQRVGNHLHGYMFLESLYVGVLPKCCATACKAIVNRLRGKTGCRLVREPTAGDQVRNWTKNNADRWQMLASFHFLTLTRPGQKLLQPIATEMKWPPPHNGRPIQSRRSTTHERLDSFMMISKSSQWTPQSQQNRLL